ncbi:unnamed protein product [Meloidogyne enterolobii]|uniref:Uncharacterized protein n=1 Tax=Meloidogyne enterolobii TaxID=390850 RepID=A0ACB1AJ88_MELEN
MDEKHQQQSPIIMDNLINNNGENSSSKISSPLLDTGQSEDPSICPYCNKKFRKPRVLDCLHSMCEDCIIAQLDDGRNNQQRNSKNILNSFMELELEDSVAGRRPTPPGVICCSVCNQETHIGNDPMFVNLMLLDFVKIREYGFNDANDTGRICEACKSEEKAVANCIHCCSDLCPKCVQVHRDMKMFDGHKVVMFSEKDKLSNQQECLLKEGGMETVKLALCNKHKGDFELICPSCDELLCKQCAFEHVEHNVSPLNDLVFKWYKQSIHDLAKQAENKGRTTLDARSAIPDRKFLLQQSYHKCRDKIEDAFQFYARVIDEVKLDLLASLDKNRDEKEEHLDSLYQKIDMQTSRLQDALSYTNNLLEKGTIVDLCLNRKKIWQQLKLLMHSMPDVNEEVDLDFDILSQHEFKKKFESVIGGIKCRITGPPKEPAIIMNALLGNSPSNKLDTFDDFDNKLKQQQQLILSSAINNCQNLANNSSIDWTDSSNLFTQHSNTSSIIPSAIPPTTNSGPGTIGMERRQNRNSNGNSYLSGDSGIYSSASDMTISSPIQQHQLGGTPETFNMGRFGIPESFGSAFRAPATSLDSGQQLDPGNLIFSDNYFGNTQSKIWSANYSTTQNMFGNFDANRPRELMDSRFGLNDFPPLGSDPSGFRSRSSLCTTPSIDTFVPSMSIHQNYQPMVAAGRHYGSNSQQQIEMQILYTFCSNTLSTQDTFNTPQGLALGLDNEVAISDTNNHRCVIVDVKGTEEGHVYYPKKVVSLIRNRDCRYIVLDRGTNQQFNRLQLFKNSGEYVCRLSLPCQIDQVSVMTVNKENEQLIIVDNKNLVHAFEFETFNQLTLVRQFSISGNVHEPSDLGVYKGYYYITDYKMHGVVVYTLEGKLHRKFGGLDTTPYPVGIDFSKSGDVLVGDSHGNHFHIVVFNLQGQPLHHYRCYQQKVSRCTGLKINSEGHIVTMSRQNSAVIVFNTLYIPSA